MCGGTPNPTFNSARKKQKEGRNYLDTHYA